MLQNSFTKLFLFLALGATAVCSYGQSFHKGTLLVSISDGPTVARYSTQTTDPSGNARTSSSIMSGERDPFTIEFGINNRIGIGLSTGADLFTVDAQKYYGLKPLDKRQSLDITTSETTFDLHYHVFANRKIDCSFYGSAGSFSVGYNSDLGETKVNYKANGYILRFGSKFRYYFWNRFGALAQLSYYSGHTKPAAGYSGMPLYSTSISGVALEIGLCFRFF